MYVFIYLFILISVSFRDKWLMWKQKFNLVLLHWSSTNEMMRWRMQSSHLSVNKKYTRLKTRHFWHLLSSYVTPLSLVNFIASPILFCISLEGVLFNHLTHCIVGVDHLELQSQTPGRPIGTLGRYMLCNTYICPSAADWICQSQHESLKCSGLWSRMPIRLPAWSAGREQS